MKPDKKFPLVSIITPAYNRADLIEETIKSVLDQKYPNLEYIIIDDGSKDTTLDVIKKYKDKVTVLTQKNTGETRTVNKGFGLAKGEIIAVINSDDPLLQNSIQTIVEYMENHPDVLAVYPDWIMIDGEGRTIQDVHPIDYNYLTMLSQHYCIPGPGTFFRKKAIKLTGGRSLEFKYLADYAFWLKLGMYGKIAHLSKSLATFRVHAGSQGIYAKGEEMAKESEKIVAWVYKDKDVPKKAIRVQNAAYASAYYHAANASTTSSQRMTYYIRSFYTNPIIFLKKTLYNVKNDIKDHLYEKNTIVMNTKKRSLSQRISAWVDRKYRRIQKIYYRDRFMHVIFSEIRQKNTWTGEESISGPGSGLSQTQEIRKKLPTLLKKLHVRSLLDIPCGDFYWMKTIQLDFLKKYIGADIIEDVIESNNKKYGTATRTFQILDVTKSPLPNVDLILLRDCLVHFSYEDIDNAIKNIKKSKSNYLLTTTFSDIIVNEDIITGYWRPINLEKPPFNFPKPLYVLNEKCTEVDGKYKDKSLGLWNIKDIKD